MLTTRPLVSSSILRADSRATPLSSLLPRKITRSKRVRTNSLTRGMTPFKTSAARDARLSIRPCKGRTISSACAAANSMPVKLEVIAKPRSLQASGRTMQCT